MKTKRIPPVKYVTLFPGRTGSTYLVSHMQTHPEVVARYEILGRRSTNWNDQLACMKELFETKRFPVVKAVGFKTKINAVKNLEAFSNYLIKNQFRIIHQVRNNSLKFIVSVVRAKMLRNAQGKSNLFEENQKPIGPIEIPEPLFARAKKRLNVAKHLEEYIESLNLPKHVIVYEGLLKNEREVLNKLWEFLGVANIATQGMIRKNTPNDIRKAVINLDEILKHHPEMAQFVDQD